MMFLQMSEFHVKKERQKIISVRCVNLRHDMTYYSLLMFHYSHQTQMSRLNTSAFTSKASYFFHFLILQSAT